MSDFIDCQRSSFISSPPPVASHKVRIPLVSHFEPDLVPPFLSPRLCSGLPLCDDSVWYIFYHVNVSDTSSASSSRLVTFESPADAFLSHNTALNHSECDLFGIRSFARHGAVSHHSGGSRNEQVSDSPAPKICAFPLTQFRQITGSV